MCKKGICALCRKEKQLELSHIIPNFVSRRIIKKSPTGFMRNPNDPDKRLQDGSKLYLLCGECEDRFSRWETAFANKVFHPYKNNKLNDFEYKDWLSKFIISINWRTLYLDILDWSKSGGIHIDDFNCLIESEQILRQYLLEERSDIGLNESHMFFFGDIKDTDKQIAESNPHVFFCNGMFDYTDIINTEYGTSLGVIANLSGILIYTIIKKLSIEDSVNTQVELREGIFKVNNQQPKSAILSGTLKYMIEEKEKQERISEKEQEKILETLKKKGKYEESEIYINQQKDKNLNDKIE